MTVNPIFKTPYQWSLAGLNGFKHPLPKPYLNRIFAVIQRALGWLLGLGTLPFSWTWNQIGTRLIKSSTPLHADPTLENPVAIEAVPLEEAVHREAVHRPPALKQALESLAQALNPHEEILCSDISLSRYFSQLPLNLLGKKIVIFCKDAGGFGDYMFGLKMLDILQRDFPGVIAALASDNPGKALKLNEQKNIQILMPQENRLLPLNEVATLIHNFASDFLIIAPVTWLDLSPFNNLMNSRPHLCIREYGFTTRGLQYSSPNDYISGPEKPFVGMLVHEPLMKWAAQREDRLTCLRHLKHLPAEISRAILKHDFSEPAIQNFAQNSLLFGCYSSRVETQIRFVLSIATEFYRHLNSDQELCFFFFGACSPDFLRTLQKYQSILEKLKIHSLELVDLNTLPHSCINHPIDSASPRKIRCIFSSLQPSDTTIIFKASEKEMQTTGDQSWSEGVSAQKRWIQERLLHKAETLVKVLNLSLGHAGLYKGAFIRLNEHLQKIYGSRRRYMESADDGYEDYALFLAESRKDPALAQAWETLNQHLLENNIRDWLIGKIIWKVLEKAYPEDFSLLQSFVGRSIKGEELGKFFLKLAERVL